MPEGWAIAPLSAISADAAQCVPDAHESFTYIDIGAIDREAKSISSPQVLLGKDAPSRARKRVIAGDTLVSMTRPNLNAVALVPPELDAQIASTGFDVLRPLKGIDPRWLGYLVRSEAFVTAMSDLVQGALYPAVRAKDVRGYVAPVAPSAEQTRIADQLDTLLARIKSCNDHLDAIPGLLKRFRQAVWDSAARGDLTGDWRAARNIALKWASCSLGDAIVEMRNGLSPKPSEHPPGKRILRISSVRPGVLDLRDYRYLDIGDQDAVAYTLRKGDLLFTRYNGTIDFVGACALVAKDINDYVYPDKLIRVRVNEKIVLPEFLAIAACAGSCRKQIEDFVKSSAGQKGISGGDLKALALFLPDIDEQAEIARRVQSLMIYDRLVEAIHSKAATFAERLPALTLAKAFRGELVPQDPDDEPASVLLARLAAERSLAGSELKARQTRAPRVTRAPKSVASSAAMPNKSRQDEDVKGQPYLANHLRRLGKPVDVKTLYEASELPVADFYKQLAWEVAQGHVNDADPLLKPARHAA